MCSLINRIRMLCPSIGTNQTSIAYLNLYRYTDMKLEMPITEQPYLYFIVEGSMRLHTPSGILDYVSGQYSVSAIDTPDYGQILTFSDEGDFLAISVEFSLDDVISVVLDIEGNLAEKILNAELSSDVMQSFDRKIISAVERLLNMTDKREEISFMSKHIKNEIIFYALCGSCGKQFLESCIRIRQAGEIYGVNSWIKQNYKTAFTVEKLASHLNISVSGFHQKFKSAVGMGPLQCQKRLRLTEARRLMLDENVSVTDAAFDVGYESLSQFNRDYKKMFELSPKEDMARLRMLLSKEKVQAE